ncbi:MAG: carboxypeptidase regulatory-like domain-containing protein [Planctomycetes bacterium]|nr:carboxypeptidase regulatory-like domain-containing protein [Planctomycetota bacterium]
MSRWFKLRVLFVVAVAAFALWTFIRERVSALPMSEPNFEKPEPPRLAPLPPSKGVHAVHGRVLTHSGDPLEEASVVVVEGGRPHTTLSGANGEYRVEGLPEGEHEVVVLSFGQAPQSFPLRLPRLEPLELVLGPPRPPLEVLPEPQRSLLRGLARHALGATGGMEIWLEPVAGSDPLTGAYPRRARVEAGGAFAFEALAHGSYAVNVLPDWASGGSWPILARADLAWHGDAQLEIDVNTASAQLRVYDVAGSPLPGALALLRDTAQPGRAWPARESDAQGEIRFDDLPVGQFELEISAGKARDVLRTFETRAGERHDLGEIVLRP